MSAIRSMTGFASAGGWAGEGVAFTVTVKSVNHRFLDVQMRLPAGCDGLEVRLRAILKERLRRGHVEVTVAVERGPAGDGVRVNDALLGQYVRLYRESAAAHGLLGEPDVGAMLRMPGVLRSDAGGGAVEVQGLQSALMPVFEEALAALNAAREEEGGTLAEVLRGSMGRILDLAGEVGDLRAGVRGAQFERLRQRIQDFLEGADIAEERLLTEAATLAERSDVEEEVVRLRAHAERFLAMLEEGGELGKRSDFLLQELNREANTLLSKTGAATGEAGLRVTELGLEMKAEIERAREQVQNLE